MTTYGAVVARRHPDGTPGRESGVRARPHAGQVSCRKRAPDTQGSLAFSERGQGCRRVGSAYLRTRRYRSQCRIAASDRDQTVPEKK
jgi:hypothetical protein